MFRLLPIIILLLLALIILGGYYFWWPKYQEFAEKKLEVEKKDEDIKQKEEYLQELNALSEKLKEYQPALSKIDIALPADFSIAALYNFLRKVSAENGLILTEQNLAGLYTQKGTLQERVQKIPFAISLSGSYSAFKNFLLAIYKNEKLFDVNSISFSSAQEGKDMFSFKLELQTYTYQELAEEKKEF